MAERESKDMIFVTGAAGHIGNVLVRELTRRGYSVKALALREKTFDLWQIPNLK
jgi:uncharacterized protein YbjT (DUF2867 family)